MGSAPDRGVAARKARGKAARESAPLPAHADWTASATRADPISLLEAQDADREPDLVPVRHGRMMVSPFTFYRGVAKIMAADLKDTPTAGLIVQLCGDAHISNFGLYASPERTLVFDVNDFDETLPGPFEYDVKRMAASITIAARNNGFSQADARTATLESVAAYRNAMAEFASMRTMDIWYARLSEHDIIEAVNTTAGTLKRSDRKEASDAPKRTKQIFKKARSRGSLQAFSKLARLVDGRFEIISQPPVVVTLQDVATSTGIAVDQLRSGIEHEFRAYRESLRDDRRKLLDRFELVDVARKVVGVGSVGTGAYIGLLQGRDQDDPLFLQVKEATASVLEDHLPKSTFAESGERVVRGQRMMQAATDIFLGWTKGIDSRHSHYWRQLRDMKGSVVIESMKPVNLRFYGALCGRTLARAHARSGDAVAIAAYLGKRDRFDTAICEFSERYADQNERDFATFTAAIESGRLEARPGV